MTFKIIDQAFSHLTHSCHDRRSNLMRWDRNVDFGYTGKLFFTDYSLGIASRYINAIKIAWILEPRSINGHLYDMFLSNSNLPFEYVVSSDREFLSNLSSSYNKIWAPVGGCWIKDIDCMIYEKTKNVSIIASSKKMTEGHRLRHEAIDFFRDVVDCYGGGYQKIPYKLDGLKEYRFHLAIENSRAKGYFTEKIIDCFSTGTVPIYWGDPSILDIFDPSGIIIFNNLNELNEILSDIMIDPESKYNSMLSGIRNNFNISKEYYLSEDWMVKNTSIFL